MTDASADVAGTDAPLIRIDGVRTVFGRGRRQVRALDGVDLEIPRGQLFGLIGHNGAGKSTLFKTLLGLLRPTAGRIAVDGIDVHGPRFRDVRRRLGYLPEHLVLYDNLSALETLHFFARLKGADRSSCRALLDEVGLAHAGERPVREFSKGMRQRLGFAQALLGEPQLLVLDEPTTGLDPQAIREFHAQLLRLKARGVTTLISSHVLAELQERVDAIAILANGQVIAHGSVQALRSRSAMPLRVDVRGEPATLAALAPALPALDAALVVEQPQPGHLVVRCPRGAKMAVLDRLTAARVADVDLHEPTLEDVYFDLRERAA